MTCSWTYEHYCYCLQQAKDKGYSIISFEEVKNISQNQPFIILRHDIDCYLYRALNMARIENKLGVRATYFVRVHALSYNVFEYNAYKALKEIHSLGHEIGLHFESIDFSYITGENPREVFLREKKVLEMVLDISIVSAAAHGEHSPAGPRHNRSFFKSISKKQAGIHYDAYDKTFIRDMKYISDSFGYWREGCMCTHIGKYPQMQILVHPCWWFKDHLFE